MEDNDKTKDQLIQELQDLRAQVSDAVEPPPPRPETDENDSASRAQRTTMSGPITFVGAFSLVEARGVDVSDSGICFELAEDLLFEMEFEMAGELERHNARIVWIKKLEDGKHRWGFEFVESDSMSVLEIYQTLDD